MPAVSVVSTVLNESAAIDALIESLMRQTLAPVEVIIVDGGSTDGTWERLQRAQSNYPALVPIRDESCSLQRSPGPIARGRNVAIAATSSDVIACADAGCTYHPDWLRNLTAPIFAGDSEYSLGGAYIDPDPTNSTVWDVASAPFFGVKLNPDAATKSCTARSMAFRKELWRRVGGFPETFFLGEDTLFDAKARQLVTPAFAKRAATPSARLFAKWPTIPQPTAFWADARPAYGGTWRAALPRFLPLLLSSTRPFRCCRCSRSKSISLSGWTGVIYEKLPRDLSCERWPHA
jgi:glycosyltransferase involved in cell wall biosynthesis